MKRMIFLIFLMSGTTILQAQNAGNDFSGPRYLPANRADSYLDFLVNANDSKATIDVSTSKNVKDYTFYLLKGVISDNGKETWSIIKTYKSSSKGFRKTFVDKIQDKGNIMYRMMVVDRDQHIEYTPIRCPEKESADMMKFASND